MAVRSCNCGDLGVLQMEVTVAPMDSARTTASRFLNTTSGARLAQREKGKYDSRPKRMRRTPAGRHPVLSSLLSLFQINDFAGVVRDTSAISIFSLLLPSTPIAKNFPGAFKVSALRG